MEQEKTSALQEKTTKEQIHNVKEIVYNETVNVPLNLSKADVEFKEFWRDNAHFTDFINGVLFQGQSRIQEKDLVESDTDVSGIIESEEVRESLQRMRDVVKKTAYGTQFIILGIENQMGIHYAMPLRTMVYDALGYVKEVKEIGKKRSTEKPPMTTDEFLSKFGKEDTITPIITIVVYYGKTPWDGPKSLKEMMPDLPEFMKAYVSNYQMNLVEVLEVETEYFQNEDVKLLFAYSQAFMQKDKTRIEELNSKYDVKKDVVHMIGKIVDGAKLLKVKDRESEEGNMCEYLQEIWDDGKKEGKEQGIEQGIDYTLLSIIIKKVRKGKAIEQIAEELEYDLEEIYDFYQVIRECGADCDVHEIMDVLEEKRKTVLC